MLGESTETPRPALTEREEDVLRCISEGLSNTEIAVRLQVKVKTVEYHLARTRRKLGLEGQQNGRRLTLYARKVFPSDA